MSSRSLNKIVVIGNIGEEPKRFPTKAGKSICTFSVVTNRSWVVKRTGERKEAAQWHYVVAFNKLAEICSQILSKGTKVFVSGRIQTRQVVNSQGERVRKTEIVASDIIALDKRKDTRTPFPVE